MIGGGNLVVAQSGGPTAVINNSLVGIVHAALRERSIEGIYGARFGIQGVLNEQLLDLRQVPDDVWKGLRATPAAALGSVRHKLTDDACQRILAVFRKHRVRYFLHIGGNDSMDTTHRVLLAAQHAGQAGVDRIVDQRQDNRLGAVLLGRHLDADGDRVEELPPVAAVHVDELLVLLTFLLGDAL
jgi:6-phosphofructokinase 1